ncbi:DUF3445 domain-containing protein [Yoonia sp. F2084L]|uniref:heme-dependent oxidative N-demethylase family protein n=1 Tax=Yoonia sp. F2084L TaxID=2926419 RepID=UPI001FF5F0CF|nr:DUF3445 domain-containing protein [Yoonia sp. F2084L]MCK0096098.1 DUF3445 domain-containing protein [Yoonia sp. F2084L]
MTVILQNALPDAHDSTPSLPGTLPCDADDWLRVDEAYAAQMAYRAQLLEERSESVLSENVTAGREVLEEALKLLPGLGFEVAADHVICPDLRAVQIDRVAPLRTLGHLAQEDICIMEKRGDEHVLTGAVLCFPANWRLADKINRPLTGIHAPVDEYDDNIARRVQRLFDGVRVGKPLWRFNKLRYSDADLHQPYKKTDGQQTPFIRSERQCILRLLRTDAVVFTIHTFVVRT